MITKYRILDPLIQVVGTNTIWVKPQIKRFDLTYTLTNPHMVVDNYVIDNSLEIEYRVEFLDVFNYISSSGSLRLSLTENQLPDLNLDTIFGTNYVLVIKIDEGNDGGYLGVIDAERSYYDRVDQSYYFYFYDIFTYIYNYYGDVAFPYFREQSLHTFTLETILDAYNPFPQVATRVIISAGNASISSNFSLVSMSVIGKMTLNSFIDQVRKHYGAYIFLDHKGTLRLVNRTVGVANTNLEISDYIINSEYVTNFAKKSEYDSVVITDYANGGAIGAILVYEQSGVANWKPLDNLNTDVEGFRYLDLRLSFPHPSAYYLFNSRSLADVSSDYRTIIRRRVIVQAELSIMGIDILQKVLLNGTEYIIMNIVKNFSNRTSNVELLKVG